MPNKFIAKIEGHGNLTIDWNKNSVKLNVLEGERLFEGMLVGRPAEEMYWITPRICGVCPVAHNLASIKAVEAALGIEPSQQTILLRQLMMAGQMIQSHMLHLYFLALSDYLGIDRATELNKKNPKALKYALQLKDVSDKIVQTVGGRSIHPLTPVQGGFRKLPSQLALKKLLKEVKSIEQAVLATADLCIGLEWPDIETDLEFVSQTNAQEFPENFVVYDTSYLVSSVQGQYQIEQYKKAISEDIKSYSTAKFGQYKGREVFVGSLARLAVQPNGLANRAKPYLQNLNFRNPYHNNFAQAIEMVHFQQQAEQILEELINLKLNTKIAKPAKHPKRKGIGAVEAPRGGLYHEVHLDKENNITYVNIITPTVQNLTSIEKSARAVLDQTKKLSQKEKERLLNMLVRAYDPCITCAVH